MCVCIFIWKAVLARAISVHFNNLASIERWIVQIQLCVLRGKAFSPNKMTNNLRCTANTDYCANSTKQRPHLDVCVCTKIHQKDVDGHWKLAQSKDVTQFNIYIICCVCIRYVHRASNRII